MILKYSLIRLRLLAGKFENIYTAFPLTTFSTKILTGGTLVIFSTRKYQHIPSLTQTDEKFSFQSFAFFKKLRSGVHNYLFVFKMVYSMVISYQS